jgi:hypothetical protein
VAAERVENADPKVKIFISYSRKDMAFVDRLEAALKARGFEPLIDREEIYAFEDWWKRLEALIAQADTVVFVLSPDAVASREALREVDYAASLNKRFAPIVCRRVEDAAVPEALRRLNFVFFDYPARFEAGADQLGRGAAHRHRLDQAAHRIRRRGAALGGGGSARPAWAAAALAGAGGGRALDRGAPAWGAGADRGNASFHRREPALGNPTPSAPGGARWHNDTADLRGRGCLVEARLVGAAFLRVEKREGPDVSRRENAQARRFIQGVHRLPGDGCGARRKFRYGIIVNQNGFSG